MHLNGYDIAIPEAKETMEGYAPLPHGKHYTIAIDGHGKRCNVELSIDGSVVGEWRLGTGTYTWYPGSWATILEPSSGKLETDGRTHKRFTFYRADSPEGRKLAAGKIAQNDLGVVKAVFRPVQAFPVASLPMVDPVPINPPAYPTPSWVVTQTNGTVRSSFGDAIPRTFTGTTNHAPTSDVNLNVTHTSLPTMDSYAPGMTGMSGSSAQYFVRAVPAMVSDESEWVTIELRLVELVTDQDPTPLHPTRTRQAPPPVHA